MDEGKDKALGEQLSRLQVLNSMVVGRMNLAAQLGQQYGTDRDIYEALGYKIAITYKDYMARYIRQDIAKAIIDKPVNATWQGGFTITESDDDEETALEKAWEELDKSIQTLNRFVRLDKLSGIGSYGVLLLGFDDVSNQEQWAQPVQGAVALKYIKPLGMESAVISTWDSKTTSPRYGMPSSYGVTIQGPDNSTSREIKVHYTRMLHVVEGNLESEIEGTPRLQAVFNRLMDLEKIVGGDAEMFWRGARPGYQGVVKEDYQMTSEAKADLIDQIDEYEHNLRRMLINDGVEMKALAQQIADPKNHVDIQIQMIAAVTTIPKRMLTGSERGELSSAEDKGEWLTRVQARRESYAEPKIVRPFVDRMIELKVLPPPKEKYNVEWEDLFSVSEKEKADIGRIRAAAFKDYMANPLAQDMIPPGAFTMFFLGFSKEEVEFIEEMRKEMEAQEPDVTPEEEAMLKAEEEAKKIKEEE